MALMDFTVRPGLPTPVVMPAPCPPPAVEASTPPILSQVAAPSQARSVAHLLQEQWDWRALRDYVVSQTELRFGPQPRDPGKEFGVFNRFVNTWGARSEEIARYAYEVCDGIWMGAPITITRFTKGNDPYFAEVIVKDHLGVLA